MSFINSDEETERFKDIKLIDKIGEGGEGVVQRSNCIDGRFYAVKVIKVETSDQVVLKKRISDLMREYLTFKNFEHSNLVS